MSKFPLTILTPQGVFYEGEVEELYLNTSLGYMGIMARHEALVTEVIMSPGFIIKDNKKEYYAIFSGVLEIKNGQTKLIVGNIEHADSIDLDRAKKAHERALNRLKQKDDAIDIKRVELALKRAITRINTVEQK